MTKTVSKYCFYCKQKLSKWEKGSCHYCEREREKLFSGERKKKFIYDDYLRNLCS
ncbi:MAG: hypothetical protein AABY22_16950 [Nanoarchaeota archaeon]